jgi:hypothetical protein
MSKLYKSIKDTLNETKSNLLKDELYRESNQNYLNKLNEIYGDNVIDLNDSVTDEHKFQTIIPKANDNGQKDNIIYLNNEVISDLEPIENETIIDLQDEIKNELEEADLALDLNEEKINEKITEENILTNDSINKLTNENEQTANLPDNEVNEVNEEKITEDLPGDFNESNESLSNDEPNDEIILNKITNNKIENSISQIEDLSGKVEDIENQNSLLFDKLDDLINQNLNFSDKLDNDLDLKLDLTSAKIDEKSELKYKALEEKILNIQTETLQQTEDLKENFANFQNQLTSSMTQISNEKNELLESVNSKMNTFNESSVNAINLLKQELEGIEPKIFNSIEEKQKNKTESEKLQDRFNDITKILDMQNMRMSQLYHSNELQNSQKILQKNMESGNQPANTESNLNPETTNRLVDNIIHELKNYNDKNFKDIKKQIFNFETNNWLEKINPTSLEKKFLDTPERFDNLHDAKNFVVNSLSKQTSDWIDDNQQKIEEISKKLLDN